jgi:hypothetical protein
MGCRWGQIYWDLRTCDPTSAGLRDRGGAAAANVGAAAPAHGGSGLPLDGLWISYESYTEPWNPSRNTDRIG